MSALAATLFLCLVTGAAVDAGFLRGRSGTGPGLVGRAGRALLLGFLAVGCASMLADALRLGVSRATVGGLVLILVVVSLWRAHRANRASRGDGARTGATAPPPESPWARAAAAALGAGAVLSLALVVASGIVRPTYQFDALVRWMFKARVLFLDGTLFGPISTDPELWFTHQRYPPLVAHLANVPALFAGTFDDRVASALFPWFAVALAGVLHGELSRRRGRFAAALAAFWIATLPLVAHVDSRPPGSGAFSAMADVPLALFVAGAALAAARALRDPEDRRARVEAGLLLGAAALTKNEGLPLLLWIPVGLLVFARGPRPGRALTVALVGAGLAGGLWIVHSLGFPALDEHYPGRLHADALAEGWSRIPLILRRAGRELVSPRNWNVTWPAVLLLLLLARRRAFERGHAFLLFLVVAQLATYLLAFVVSGWSNPYVGDRDPVGRLMALALGRLLLHVAPVAIYLAVDAAYGAGREDAPSPERSAEPAPT